MQRTLKRELKVLEIVGEEAIGTQYVMVVRGSGGKGGNGGFNLSHREVAIGFIDLLSYPSYSPYHFISMYRGRSSTLGGRYLGSSLELELSEYRFLGLLPSGRGYDLELAG